ncbi:putative protein OS=Streptomyces glaucescens OX=1907 GN=SGLAU_05835 PE=4 SV=1 [Streptomyces glaucescens]
MTAEAPIAPALAHARHRPLRWWTRSAVHNARYPRMVERARPQLWQEHGFRFRGDGGCW